MRADGATLPPLMDDSRPFTFDAVSRAHRSGDAHAQAALLLPAISGFMGPDISLASTEEEGQSWGNDKQL